MKAAEGLAVTTNSKLANEKNKGQQSNGSIESSFDKLLKWRESGNLRVLNVTEQCGGMTQDNLLLGDKNTVIGSEKIIQTTQSKITVLKKQ